MIIKTIIADDHQIIIDGIKSILATEKNIAVIGEAANGEEVLDMIKREKPDLVIMDINMPQVDGIEATLNIRRKYPGIKVLILTMYNDAGFIKKMAEAGAHGFILKNTGSKELMLAIHLVMEGNTYYEQKVMDALVKSYQRPKEDLVKLTKRETDVLSLLAEGLTTPEIAEKLFIATHTVESHRKNLLSKCGQKTSAGLVKYAMEHKLLPSSNS